MEVSSEQFMRVAIGEARRSLREGNHGFGAVIVRNGEPVASAHDTEETDQDPTAHAEMNAVRKASALVGKDLSGCLLFCTHEPCPMCATAILWAHLPFVAYGVGIEESLEQGRNRIALTCAELFQRSGASIRVEPNLLHEECAVFYDRKVRDEVRRLRGASDEELKTYDRETKEKRLRWYRANPSVQALTKGDPLEAAYRVLLLNLGLAEDQAPIARRNAAEIVFHSANSCSTLEACRILEMDPRRVCKLRNENATQELIRQVDPRLRFSRNYEKLRPQSAYCEEIIRLEE
jgi:tRNA(adenine34) deaminase